MMTLRRFCGSMESIPINTSWYLADLSEAKGRQELFTKQSPQRLKTLREHALIDSAISSNRIEGVTVDQARIGTILFGEAMLQDRNEEEVRGYRLALNRIHELRSDLRICEETVLELHRLSHGEIWDAGQYKHKDGDIIETYSNGRSRVRFKTVSAKKTPAAMHDLFDFWERCLEERRIHPLIILTAFVFDFLCIHPFRDGNGRVSRLLLLLGCYHFGFEVGRYISLERLIEDNKERYYETLKESSQGWHQGNHNPWPHINYLLFVLKNAYREFEDRLGRTGSPRGTKSELVDKAIQSFPGGFTLTELEHACPGVSRDMIRKILKKHQKAGKIECLGRGPGAAWRKRGITS